MNDVGSFPFGDFKVKFLCFNLKINDKSRKINVWDFFCIKLKFIYINEEKNNLEEFVLAQKF